MRSFQGGWPMMARRWLLVVLCGVIVLTLVTMLMFREFDFGTSLPSGFPNNVPIIPGTLTSSNALFGKNTVIVMINATGATTSVLVQVRGTSIFTLPR